MNRVLLSLTLGLLVSVSYASNPKITCEYTIGFSRSDHAPDEFHSVVVPGDPGDSFSFSGCSAEYATGKYCLERYGISAGARLLKNQNGEVVAEGNCCNSVTNKVTSVWQECVIRIATPGTSNGGIKQFTGW